MNEAEYQELLETSWQRELTTAEKARLDACLAQHPAWRADWQDESSLDAMLSRLPDVPVASNFTTLVLNEARRQAVSPRPRAFLGDLWRRLFPRRATGVVWLAVMGCLGWLAVQQAQTSSQQRRNTELADFFKAAAPSDPVVLQDFDAIRRLPQPDDEELLAVLSK
ncbi:MAG: hypothetical protein QOF48_2600 [Verrucomicrobiota bacterium]|jgi:anti-sigma factor RsiW